MTPLFNARRNGDDSLKTDGSLIIAKADTVSDNGCAPTREPKTFPVSPLQTDFERYGIEHVRPRFDPARLPPNGAPDGLVDLLVLWAGIWGT